MTATPEQVRAVLRFNRGAPMLQYEGATPREVLAQIHDFALPYLSPCLTLDQFESAWVEAYGEILQTAPGRFWAKTGKQ